MPPTPHVELPLQFIPSTRSSSVFATLSSIFEEEEEDSSAAAAAAPL
jgi:hypothetical protein